MWSTLTTNGHTLGEAGLDLHLDDDCRLVALSTAGEFEEDVLRY